MRYRLAALASLLLLAASGVSTPAQTEETPPETPREAAVPAPAIPGPITLGDFVKKVAIGKGYISAGEDPTVEGAALVLLRNGIDVRPELGSPLTEADAVGILNHLGFKVRTDTPSRTLDHERAEILLMVLLTP